MNNRKKTGQIIAVVGPHYAGKSTLCDLFHSSKGFEVIKEKWWKDPYKKTRSADYFKSEVWYLLQTSKALLQADTLRKENKNVILDTFPLSTLIFAETKLKTEDLKTFRELTHVLINSLPAIDVLVYLYARPEFLFEVRKLKRIQEKSGPPGEEKTSYEWFKKICRLNKEYFDGWKSTPTIKIDVEKVDFLNNKEHFEMIVSEILDLKTK